MALFQYNLGSEIPFSSIDYGFINETPTTPSEDHGDLAVVPQTTIAPDDIVSTYSGSLSTVTITNTGSGVGEFGGFNVARHIKFTGAGTRAFSFAFDTSNREEITFSVIRGTDSNGGELPDTGEDLLFEYSTNGGSTWTGAQVLVAYNDTAFNNLNDVTVTLPTAARVSNAQFRIRQASNSGSNYDQWGVTAVTIGGEILTTEDYGFLTPARQTVPYGRLKIVEEFADDRLLRNSVGGIEFTLGGEAQIFTLPIHVGRGFLRLDGKEFTRITLRYIGSGTFSHFGGSAEAVSNATPAQTPLFTVAGVATEKFGKGNYTVTGQFSAFTGAAEVVSISGATRQDLFRIRGAAHDTHTENYVGEGRLFAVQGASEAFKVEEKATGLFSFKGTSKETIQSNNVVSVETQLSGSGTESITPAVLPGSGEATLSGAITNEHVRYHQFGTGTLSSFSGTAETSNRVVFSYNESSVVNAETLDYGLITEGFADEPISNYANVPISTLANEVVSEFGRYPNREEFGHISIDPEQSIHTPGYNHVDYGHINTTNRFPFGKFQSEDGGDLTYESAQIGIRVRPVTPGPTHRLAGEAGVFTLPIHFGEGYFRLAGKSVVRIRAVYYGSGKFSNFGGSAEATANVDSGRKILFRVAGDAHAVVRFVYVGEGSLFTFVSKTESTSVTEKPYVLHKFSGGAVEKNTENYVGRGSLFGFVSSTEATVVKSTSSGLFKIQGSGIEKNTENYVGQGSLFGFVSKSEATVVQSVAQTLFRFTGAITNEHVRYHQFGTGTFSAFSGTAYHERVAFDYNEDSIVNVRHENYGLITEGSADQPISDFANDPISLYANEQVSEFGRFANREDFGHISIDPEQSVNTHGYNHDDYGFINTTNRFPFGGFTFDDGSVTSATSKFQVKLPVEGPVFQLRGEGEIYVLPVHIGTGITRLGGDATIRIRAVYYGSGTAFSFVSGAEVTCSVPPTEAPLLDFNGTAKERFGKGNYDATGTFSTFSGAAESTVINSKSQVLFDVNGTALEKHTENYVGEGSLFGFVSATESTVINSAASGLFKFQGGAIEKNTENYVGTGSLFTFDSSTEATEVLSTAGGLFKFTGAATNVQVRFHQLGSGSLFGIVGHAEAVTFDYNCHSSIVNIGADNYGFITESVVDETISNYANEQISTYANEVVSDFGLDPRQESFGHISIDPEQSINTHGYNHENYGLITEPEGGNKFPCVHIHIGGERLSETRARGYAGSGTFSAFIGAAEVVAQTDDTFGLFKVHGSAGIVASLSHTGSGFTRIGDSGIDKFVKVQFSPPTTGVLFKFSGGLDVSGVKERPSDLKATFAEVGHAKLRIAGDAFTTFHLGHIGSGQLDINGNAIEKHTEAYVGSGSLFAFTGGAESFTVDLPEFATLFRFAGNAVEKNTENYVGTGSLFTFVSKTESTTSAEQPKVLFNIEGASVNRILFHYPGSGTFSKFGGAAEARAVVKKAGGLFTFSGNAPESITPAPEIGSGSLFTFVGKTEAFAASDDFAPPLFKIGGDAIIGFSLGIIGRGGLDVLQKVTKLDVEGKNRFVGAQERRAVNNPASVLFSIDGNVKIFFVFQEVGGGFTRISGEAFTEVTPRHTGRGKASINGDSIIGITLSQIGSGTIFGFVGGAEATAVDTPPRGGLLRFAGTSEEAFQRGPEIGTASLQIKSSPVHLVFNLSHISDGDKITIFGDGAESRSRLYEGSGSLFSFSGATESRVIDLPPQIPTLFKFAGNSGERETNAHQGTGSLFGFDSATEVRTASPELSGLFKVQGTGAEAKTKVFTGSGTFDLNTKRDGVDVSGKQVYISAPESITVNPPEETQVFSFTGAAVATEDRAYKGTGSLFGFTGAAESRGVAPESTGLFKVQGSGEESRSRIYSGTGRVFGFTGGAEATAVTENVPGSLFKLTGTVTVLFQRTPFVGSGSLFSFTGATETTAVAPPVATLFEFNGSGAESRTRPYQGSGTLVAFKSATVARRVPYSATQGLFKLAGALRESFVPSGYVGTTGVQFIGASADRRIEFESPKPTQIYIV